LATWYGLSDSLTSLMEADAARAGERSRIMLEIKRNDEEERRSIRRRLASTLVQLGVRLDPLAADDLNNDES
jgi:hypothetical protein